MLRVDLDVGGSAQLAQAVPMVHLDVLRNQGLTGSGVTAAVLDSGVLRTHTDLSNDVVDEHCFCPTCCPNGTSEQSGTGSAQDANGHGTNVTGILTSTGIVAPRGGAPDTKIVAVRVLDANGNFASTSDVIAGLDWVIANHPEARVVNMSLGTSARFSGNCDNATSYTMAFASAINTLRSNGTLTFVSSGNEGSGTTMRAPACVANAIAVGAVWDGNVGSVTILGCTDATTQADQVTCFSNSDTATDLFAPGAPTTSTGNGGGTSTYYGTSQAAPLVAACAAALWQAFPSTTPATMEAALKTTTTFVTDATNGLSFPRLNCEQALAALVSPPVPTPTGTATTTATPTSTTTATATAIPTATATVTASVSATPSATVTETPTLTPTATASATPTSAPTATASASTTPTPTFTPTRTATPTDTPAPTPTTTASRTPTATPTPSTTPTPTATSTPDTTPSITPTATPAPLCADAPRTDCRTAGKTSLVVKRPAKITSARIGWRWLRGEHTDVDEWGDPHTDTTFALCVYDEAAGLPHLALALTVPPGGTCNTRPCWSLRGGRVLTYADKPGTADGVQGLSLKSGDTSRAAIKFLAGGGHLHLPAPNPEGRLFTQDTRVTVQLVSSGPHGERCWGAAYAVPARSSSATVFSDKTP